MPNRRQYLSLTATAITAGLAGCSGLSDTPVEVTTADGASDNGTATETTATTDDTTTEEETTETDPVTATIGELVKGDRMSLVVEDFQRGVDLGEYYEAESENEFALVSIALKNTSTEYVTVSNLLQTRLRDDDDYAYLPTFASNDAATFNNGQFAPGEIERVSIPFEIRTDASRLEFLFDVDGDLFGGLNMAIIDLESAADSVHTLEQSLQVDVHKPGTTIEHGSVQVTVNDYRTERSFGDFADPAAGNEYAIVDISMTNNTGEQQRFSRALQMMLKDGEGYTYQEDLVATGQLNQAFDEGTPLRDGETRRGQLVYQVPEDEPSLYWVFEFDLFTSGNKMFWQVH
jgi:hypothetical protein